MSAVRVVAVERLELAFVPRPWPFAVVRRAQIDDHFAALKRERPALWNGRVLLMHEYGFAPDAFHGAFFETDFASLVAWRDWGFPDAGVTNCFAQGAVRCLDGAFILGVMGAHTANAGRIYFPSGTPEPHDVIEGRVDMNGSLAREVAEETGLAAGDYEAEPGWLAVVADARIALIKILLAGTRADDLRARIRAHLARQAEPELADVHIVRGPGDLDPMMPVFVPAFLHYVWNVGGAASATE
jgi:8-oxo-dGTP pyrophosphatase MutT (NUDIX family)